MSEPRLTIAIPHLDRSDFLQRALDSCLAQTVPVRVIVADQGRTDRTKWIMDRYADHPHVRHVYTDADCLWSNWRAAAEASETEFFAFLQDDDILAHIYASRVIQAMDRFPDALHWQANCHCSPDGVHALKYGWNGPQLGVRMLDMQVEKWAGGMLLASMYICSWALSPGVAFRDGPEFRAAIEGMPKDCDLFAERLILAAMGAQGPWVADPVTAGYWVHHGRNESYKQNDNGSLPTQRAVMAEHLDDLLDRFGDWQVHFFGWLRMRSPLEILGWMSNWDCPETRHREELLRVMSESVRDRIQSVPAKPDDDVDGPLVIYGDEAA